MLVKFIFATQIFPEFHTDLSHTSFKFIQVHPSVDNQKELEWSKRTWMTQKNLNGQKELELTKKNLNDQKEFEWPKLNDQKELIWSKRTWMAKKNLNN